MDNRIYGILIEHGTNDYGIWQGFHLSEEDENAIWNILQKYDTQGCSLKGTLKEIAMEIFDDTEEKALEFAKSLLSDYSYSEFGHDIDVSDLSDIAIAYTTLTDKEVEIQVTVDLLKWKMKTWIANQLVEEINIGIPDLEYLTFDSLVGEWESYIEENIDRFVS